MIILMYVRNAKAVSTAKQLLYVMNVQLIVDMVYTVISTMVLAQTAVLMDGLGKSVINHVHWVALYVSSIIQAHVVNVT